MNCKGVAINCPGSAMNCWRAAMNCRKARLQCMQFIRAACNSSQGGTPPCNATKRRRASTALSYQKRPGFARKFDPALRSDPASPHAETRLHPCCLDREDGPLDNADMGRVFTQFL